MSQLRGKCRTVLDNPETIFFLQIFFSYAVRHFFLPLLYYYYIVLTSTKL